MTYQKKRFYFEADEANYLRLQMVIGKSFIQQKDFQNIVASYLHNLTKQKKWKHLSKYKNRQSIGYSETSLEMKTEELITI